MKIYNNQDGIEVTHQSFMFPDGQWHVAITGDLGHRLQVTIETAIRNDTELMQVLLASDALWSLGCRPSLDIRYLMGARMDRRIAPGQPATLEVVARMLRLGGFERVRILDAHSSVATRYLSAENVLPYTIVDRILANYPADESVIVIPDKGAAQRVEDLVDANLGYQFAHGYKVRDSQTGRLSGFGVDGDVKDVRCLIIDDICDGGGTFAGLARVLRAKGAASVDLFVTHGIFSRGLPIPGIDSVYCTDSYQEPPSTDGVVCHRINMRGL